MSTIIGTCHFLDREAVAKYYQCSETFAEQIIAEGRVCVGAPTVQPGDGLVLGEDNRWIILCGEAEKPKVSHVSALAALEAIQKILSGNEWDSDTPGFIADVMTDLGYEIKGHDEDDTDD